MTLMLPGSLERKCLSQIVSVEYQPNSQCLCKSLMLLLKLITLLFSFQSHQRSFRRFRTTQPTMLTNSYCKTRSRGDSLWKKAMYLKPFDHILHFATKSCAAVACIFEEISLWYQEQCKQTCCHAFTKVIKVSIKASNVHEVYFSGQADRRHCLTMCNMCPV